MCPNSSVPVRRDYALALERIGNGRPDAASREQCKLARCLAERDYDAQTVCSRIRIRTVSALPDAGDAITAARAELGHICADKLQVIPAWHALRQDALSAIARKGRRTLRNLIAQLSAAQIDVRGTAKDSPVAICDRLLGWTLSRTEEFQVPGISQPFPTDRAWLPLSAIVRDGEVEPAPSAEKALTDYHALGEQSSPHGDVIHANTIGTFRKLCVVVGGPGSGKSLLLRVLARQFAKDSYVSVHVRLRDLATRINNTGCGVEEGLLNLGLDGTGISPKQLCAASLSDLVLLCDGLDECGGRQLDIATGLQNIAASNPSYRILVTTRPIGYNTPLLHDWRHYEIPHLPQEATAQHLATLCRCALPEENAEGTDDLLARIDAYAKEDSVSQMLGRSPLLLALAASLFLNSSNPSQTKVHLYQRIFRLLEGAPKSRETGIDLPAKDIRNSVLNQLGWLIAATPLLSAEELQRHCAEALSHGLQVPDLRARTYVEASIVYWEETGLIERLHHQGTELIAFTHKTFGEYTAALHLSEMRADEARQAVRSALSVPDWGETWTSLAAAR